MDIYNTPMHLGGGRGQQKLKLLHMTRQGIIICSRAINVPARASVEKVVAPVTISS